MRDEEEEEEEVAAAAGVVVGVREEGEGDEGELPSDIEEKEDDWVEGEERGGWEGEETEAADASIGDEVGKEVAEEVAEEEVAEEVAEEEEEVGDMSLSSIKGFLDKWFSINLEKESFNFEFLMPKDSLIELTMNGR